MKTFVPVAVAALLGSSLLFAQTQVSPKDVKSKDIEDCHTNLKVIATIVQMFYVRDSGKSYKPYANGMANPKVRKEAGQDLKCPTGGKYKIKVSKDGHKWSIRCTAKDHVKQIKLGEPVKSE